MLREDAPFSSSQSAMPSALPDSTNSVTATDSPLYSGACCAAAATDSVPSATCSTKLLRLESRFGYCCGARSATGGRSWMLMSLGSSLPGCPGGGTGVGVGVSDVCACATLPSDCGDSAPPNAPLATSNTANAPTTMAANNRFLRLIPCCIPFANSGSTKCPFPLWGKVRKGAMTNYAQPYVSIQALLLYPNGYANGRFRAHPTHPVTQPNCTPPCPSHAP